MQGPVDEIKPIVETSTVPFQIDEGFSRLSEGYKVQLTESGTCNVCSAPCSSCVHITRALMGSKTVEFSDEPYRENTLSYSVNDVATTAKGRRSKMEQHATSETSNLMSSNSSRDCFSENAESNAHLRTCNVSGESGDVEISPKLSSGEILGGKNHSLKSECFKNKSYLTNKFDDPSGLEGHDDNISSVSGAGKTNKISGSLIQDTDRINLPSCSASAHSLVIESHGKSVPFQTTSDSLDIKFDVEGSKNNFSRQSRCNEEPIQKVSLSICTTSELSSRNSELTGNHSDKLAGSGTGVQDVRNVEDSCSQLKGEPECSTKENSGSLMTKEEVCDLQRPASFISDYIQSSKDCFDGRKLEVGTLNCANDLPDKALNSEEQGQEIEKVGYLLSLPDAKGTSFQSHHVDGSDESDIVEHDVKVCDICGDAGREDLLAICCRCSDGAEHTYCMRERLDKVPEGDWLCEECKFSEEIETQRQGAYGREYRVEKDQPSGQADSEIATVCLKSDAKVTDIEGNRSNKGPSSAKGSGKRHAEDTEVSSAAKRQALEPIIGSPKTTTLSRVRTLSRGSSSKNLDSAKVKPTQQLSSGLHFVGDTSEVACSPTTGPRSQTMGGGGFLKSNSFNFSNAKSKVKLVDEVPHKQRSSKEPASRDTKEGSVRGISKSMSFKSTTSARSSTNESKVKMLSPRFPHLQDLKGLRHSNEKNFFERKNSFKSPRSSVNPTTLGSTSTMSKGDPKLASRGESVSLSSSSNAELKAAHLDSKSNSGPKSLNYGPRRGGEGPTTTGELKRQLSALPSVAGAASSNGLGSSVELKAVEASMKDESSSNSHAGEDELPRPRESTNVFERIKESSSHLRQNIDISATSVPCPKCKEIGHSAQSCTIESHHSIGSDLTSPRSSKEGINKGNKLKAAIEAAMLKKPTIYRRNRIPCQSDDVTVSSMVNESASQDQLSSSSSMRTMNSVEVIEGQAILRNSDADLYKQTNGSNGKQFMAIPSEARSSSSGDGSLMVPSDGKHSNMGLPNHASPAISLLLQMSAIPDHEYIWQGSFEVHKSRRTPELYDGFQAHLSTCASPKVIEAVNKFPRRVLMSEVPRLSAWPIQFEESGVKEDNIALYFFAREFESYERSYKFLVERMMRSDLALKGNIDGVELLIFPSNQLPEKSQRWNMLFFLWGVFRGKRESCLHQVPDSPKKLCIPPDVPDAILSLPENICSLGSTDKNLTMPDSARAVVSKAPASIELPTLSSVETKNRELQDSKPYSNSSTSTHIIIDQSRQEMLGHISSDTMVDKELQVSVQATSAICGTKITMGEKTTRAFSAPLDRQQEPANYIDKAPTGEDMASFATSISEENVAVQNRMDNSQDVVKCSRNHGPEKGSLDAEANSGRGMVMGVQIKTEVSNWQLDPRKRSYAGSTERMSEVAYSGSSQTKLWNDVNDPLSDGKSANKKQKTGPFEWNNDKASFFREDFASRMHDGALSPQIKEEKQCDTPSEVRAIPMNSEDIGERFFFPVDPPSHVKGDNFIPWMSSSRSENEDEKLRERAPNLELALGGTELKTSRQISQSFVGKIDINLDEEPPEVEEEEDVSASLSLSLSFPMPDKEVAVPAVARGEPTMPEKRHVNPSVLLFGGFSDK